ncbi:MAG TPA: CoA-binding protein [Bacteroidales bacterium]|nr:CoA-binding protein [Bacteroidales bacterium]
MNTRQIIDIFLNEKKMALAGVSHNPRKFGFLLFKTAKERGFDVIPVNPKGGNLENIDVVKAVADLDSSVQNLLIATHKRDTKKVLEEAIAKGIKNIWIQNGCESPEALKLAAEKNIDIVSKACFLMYAAPKGMHKFHQTIAKWTGKYMKEMVVSVN